MLDAAFVGMRDSYDEWRTASTHIETDHELFDQLLRRALQDLRLLIDNVDGDLVPTAGIPWFAVPFGRDSLITVDADAVAAARSIAAARCASWPSIRARRSTTSATSSPARSCTRSGWASWRS